MPLNDMDMTNLIGRNVLVTGGSGSVGSHLVDRLRAYGGDAVSDGPRTEDLPLPESFRRASISIDKAERLLGWRLTQSLQHGLEEYIDRLGGDLGSASTTAAVGVAA